MCPVTLDLPPASRWHTTSTSSFVATKIEQVVPLFYCRESTDTIGHTGMDGAVSLARATAHRAFF